MISKLKIVTLCACIWGVSACSRLSDEQQLEWARGQEVYLANCLSCHGADGKGLGGTYPTLTRESIASDFTERAKYLIEKGSPGNGGMLAIPISKKETIEVINYIQNAWGNEADFVTLSPQLSKK
ncbi:c-type cytochrome [Reichenbachiella sp.]|uniref:c-type cytochrome n=1 Tax=Reichenbachiella sp. TaxID=2184521 RepID=UPI003B58BA37